MRSAAAAMLVAYAATAGAFVPAAPHRLQVASVGRRAVSSAPPRSLSVCPSAPSRTKLDNLAVGFTGLVENRGAVERGAGKLPLRTSADEDSDAVEEYVNSKMSYRIEHPTAYKKSNKPVKTHLDEVQFKKAGGTEVGITVDPVKIDTLSAFGTPKQVAKRVLDAEKGRDGVTNAKILAFGDVIVDDVDYYTVEYQSSSSRGDKHFISKVTIVGKKLYVLTALAKKDKFEEEEEALRAAVASFAVTPPE